MNITLAYKAVLFDLDGTLLDTSSGVLKSIEYTIDYLKLPKLSEEKKKSFIGPPIFRSLQETYNLSDADATAATEVFRNVYKDVFLLDAIIYDGMTDLLEKLRSNHIKIAVATYKRDDYTKRLLQHFGISSYCDFIMGSDANNKLTKIDIIEECLRQLEVRSTADAVLIGDTEHDAIGADKTGIDFIGVTYGFGFKSKAEINKYRCTFCADSVKEIENYLFI